MEDLKNITNTDLKNVINIIEELEEEINKMKTKITELMYEEDIKYVYSKLINDYLHDHQLNTIFFIHNNNIKYIIRYPHLSGFKSLIIVGKKAYLWESYELGQNKIVIKYTNDYDIEDDIIKTLERIPESNIDHAEPLLFKLYHILKKNYPVINFVNFVKVKYT